MDTDRTAKSARNANDTGTGDVVQKCREKCHPTPEVPGTHDGTVVSLWMKQAEICEHLGISKRTLYRKADSGKIARRRVGRRVFYRVVHNDDTSAPGVTTMALVPKVPVVMRSATPDTDATRSASDPTDFIGLVKHLTDRVAELERSKAHLEHERDEAIAIGHHIANARDELVDDKARMTELLTQAYSALVTSNTDVRRLHDAVDSLTDAIAAICTSPLAVPVRRRLRATLATC